MPEFGTIVLVPFPFTDLSSAKVRPALIVSRSDRQDDDIIVCFITSRLEEENPAALILDPDKKNGLKVRSAVRFDKIATLEKRIILGEIGRIAPAILGKNAAAFFDVFGWEKAAKRSE